MSGMKSLIYAIGLIAITGFNFVYADDESHANHMAALDEENASIELGWSDDPSDEMTDKDLLIIEGKGWAAGRINENDALAVILWDEQGSVRKTTLSDNNHSQQQTITLRFNQR